MIFLISWYCFLVQLQTVSSTCKFHASAAQWGCVQVPENQQMKHLLLSKQPMCFLSSVSWSALNTALVSCLCSSAEATDSWACCVWATAGERNAWCVCCRGTEKNCSHVHVRTDRCGMVGSRTTTAGYLFEAQHTGGLLMKMRAGYLHPSTLYRSTHISCQSAAGSFTKHLSSIEGHYFRLCICID